MYNSNDYNHNTMTAILIYTLYLYNYIDTRYCCKSVAILFNLHIITKKRLLYRISELILETKPLLGSRRKVVQPS